MKSHSSQTGFLLIMGINELDNPTKTHSSQTSNARDNDQLREENERLLEDKAQLADDLENERGVSGCLASRVVELEDLCNEKDAYFQEMISDGLRHGSSLAGKHMADRKQYLNEE